EFEIIGELPISQLNGFVSKRVGMLAQNSNTKEKVRYDGTAWKSDTSQYATRVARIKDPRGGLFDLSGAGSTTGALVIRFPFIPSGTGGLIKLKLDISDDGTP